MAYDNPTIQDFKDRFFRDFPYGTDPATSVLDQDIANAYGLVNINVSQDLFSDTPNYQTGYMLLAAHFLVTSLRASSQGLSGQSSGGLVSSKSVGSVSTSFTIPQRILDNPEFAWLSSTPYGMQYLFMLLPQLTGQIYIAPGRTLD